MTSLQEYGLSSGRALKYRFVLICTTGGPAASLGGGVLRAYEGADEFVAYLWCDGVGIDPRSFQEFFGVVDAVDAGGFNVDGFESRGGELLLIFRVCQRACDAADPEFHALANRVRDFASNYYIGNCETAAGLEHPECFAQNAVLVAGEVNDTVGQNDVDGVVGQRDIFDLTFQKFNVGEAGFAFVFFGQGEHFVGHVQAVGFSGGADTARGKQNVNAAARS